MGRGRVTELIRFVSNLGLLKSNKKQDKGEANSAAELTAKKKF